MRINIKTLVLVLALGSSSTITGCMADEVIEPLKEGSTLATDGEEDDDPVEPGSDE